MRRMTFLGLVLVASALTPLTFNAPAQALGTDCTADLALDNISLEDSTPALWDITADGVINDGGLLDAPGGTVTRGDAYDTFPFFAIDDGTHGVEDYANPNLGPGTTPTCTYELGGRQLAFPAATTAGGLELSRKVYVPATGPGFARFYNQVHNPGTSPVTIDVLTSDGNQGNLGSDTDTQIADTSAGSTAKFVDSVLDTPVSWLTTYDGDATAGDPVLGHNLDGGFAAHVDGARDRVDTVAQTDGEQDDLTFRYKAVTVPAGGTVAYLEFESQRATPADASAAARYIDAMPAAIFAGLTPSEVAASQNWTTDRDSDGVPSAMDNCSAVANANQADLDHDGTGDACDPDADGDGLANTVETALGLNPLSADTDGDGVKDSTDACPKVAGIQANGCPPSARRASKTTLKVHENTTGAVVLKSKGKVRSRSTRLANDCTHGRAAVIVKIGTKVVSTKIVKLKSTCVFKSKLTLDMPRKKVHDVKVTGWFLGSDGLLPSKDRVKLS